MVKLNMTCKKSEGSMWNTKVKLVQAASG